MVFNFSFIAKSYNVHQAYIFNSLSSLEIKRKLYSNEINEIALIKFFLSFFFEQLIQHNKFEREIELRERNLLFNHLYGRSLVYFSIQDKKSQR